MALPLGSVTVPRTEVVACPAATPLPSSPAKRVNTRVDRMSERREEREWNTKARRDNEVFLGISFPSRTAIHSPITLC
jgi:hypothetical protein